jgi:diacylglycerol kinase (ATP)
MIKTAKRESQTNTIQLFCNAAAGGYSGRLVADFERSISAKGHHVILSKSGPDHPVAIAADANIIAAVGGDGTVRHVVASLRTLDRDVPVMLCPAGTINLLARELPSSGGDIWPAQVNEQTMLACVSVGPDSYAVDSVSLALKKRIGRLAYAVAFLKVFIAWPRHQIRLQVDGKPITCSAFYVAKARYFAGPWTFAPKASASEPLLHGVALHGSSRTAYLRFMWALITNNMEHLEGVTQFTCASLEASALVAMPVQIDGDSATQLPVQISLWPKNVRILSVFRQAES